MRINATSAKGYLAALPAERRKAITAIRKVILANLDSGFTEGVQYGAIGYFVPHSNYPAGYHCDPKQPLPFAGLASQKNHIGIYLFCLYTDAKEEASFRKDWKKSGKKLDMGKSCVRVKKLEDVALDVLGKAIKRITVKKFIESYEKGIANTAAGKKHFARKAKLEGEGGSAAKTAKKKTAKKKTAKKKTAKKKTAKKKTAKKKTAKKKTAKKKRR
jgi:hypothetical protein